ncbi:MAG TPA: hypothetical protein ACFYD6_01450 [Candidatus Brocadiia bacterium]|nr:hypothetical protein [Planctomycetota bacterium]MBI4007077.1 hypothetical protein [Planctomycetota bacterium]MDO8092374.1 hypothetical protein [Candidatus Brocadiales bacterium]
MLKTYDLIKKLAPKLGEDEAKDLISFVEESKGEAATKADLQIFATKTDLEKQIQALRTELKIEMQTIKSDLLKWQFGFWITIIIAILIKGFLK